MPSFFSMACLKAAVRDRQLWVESTHSRVGEARQAQAGQEPKFRSENWQPESRHCVYPAELCC